MNYLAVSSSNIAAIAYGDEGRILGVRFNHGGEYWYHGVPITVYQRFLGAGLQGHLLRRVRTEHVRVCECPVRFRGCRGCAEMADLTVRVELHGAEWEDYDALRVEMEAEGFSAAVQESGGTA